MKIITGLVLGLLVATFPPSAMARDFCISEGIPNIPSPTVIHLVWKAFTIPGRGACKPVIAVSPDAPGVLYSGAACTTTDRKTLLFTLFSGADQYTGAPSWLTNQQGNISLATGGGSLSGITTSLGMGAASYSTGTVSIEACPKTPTPITAASGADE
jgi:hypothetical protein